MMGRMARGTYATGELERYFKDKGMAVRFWQFEAEHMLHVLAKPDIGQLYPPTHFLHWKIDSEPALWRNCWWARLGRWIDKYIGRINAKTGTNWHLPLWMTELIYASRITFTHQAEALPKELLERIQIMRHYLMNRDIKPTKVIMGAKAKMSLQKEATFGYGIYWPVTDFMQSQRVFDLKIQVNPFLAEDAVIVC